MTSIAIRFYNSLNELQRINQFVNITVGSIQLSRLETFLLVELHADSCRGIGELANLLGPDRSTISRTISGLSRKNLLKTSNNSKSRNKRFSLTPDGLKTIKLIDARAEKILKRLTASSGKLVLKDLTLLFNKVATALGQPPGIKRPSESAYRVEQRRITRAFGLLNEQAFNSGLSQFAFHFLLLLEKHGSLTAAQACEILNAQAAAMSFTVGVLEKQKLIARLKNSPDKREMGISLTKLGEKRLIQIRSKCLPLITKAISSIPKKTSDKLVSAFEKFVTAGESPASLNIKRLTNKNELKNARTFAIQCLVQNNNADTCPEILFTEQTECYGLYKDNILVGVKQIDRCNKSNNILILSNNLSFQENTYLKNLSF